MMWWKKGDGGFYDVKIENGIELTDEEWQSLLDGQSQGKEIVEDEDGHPILRDPVISLEDAKAVALAGLYAYNSSDEVNTCSVNGVNLWLDKSSRALFRMQAQDSADDAEFTLYGFDGSSVTLICVQLKAFLSTLESYAMATYGVTRKHETTINALDDVTAVQSYNFTAGYPEPLVMTFE